jgi:hypothetical protein
MCKEDSEMSSAELEEIRLRCDSATPGSSHSASTEKELSDHSREVKRQAIHQRDFELINANADYLNSEAEDVLRYQADIFEDWAPRQ